MVMICLMADENACPAPKKMYGPFVPDADSPARPISACESWVEALKFDGESMMTPGTPVGPMACVLKIAPENGLSTKMIACWFPSTTISEKTLLAQPMSCGLSQPHRDDRLNVGPARDRVRASGERRVPAELHLILGGQQHGLLRVVVVLPALRHVVVRLPVDHDEHR